MKKRKLDPCPKCGGKPKLERTQLVCTFFLYRCRECSFDYVAYCPTKKMAREQWNGHAFIAEK